MIASAEAYAKMIVDQKIDRASELQAELGVADRGRAKIVESGAPANREIEIVSMSDVKLGYRNSASPGALRLTVLGMVRF